MKFDSYKIVFKSGIEETVYASGCVAAKILAQASQISRGNDFSVESIWVEQKIGFPAKTQWNLIPKKLWNIP